MFNYNSALNQTYLTKITPVESFRSFIFKCLFSTQRSKVYTRFNLKYVTLTHLVSLTFIVSQLVFCTKTNLIDFKNFNEFSKVNEVNVIFYGQRSF